jgi:hypothetical protein
MSYTIQMAVRIMRVITNKGETYELDKKDNGMTNDEDAPDTEGQTPSQTYPTLSIDWDLYGECLEESDLTDDQKREFIETLWSIVVSFVDLGFGIAPTQQACEQPSNLSTAIQQHVINSKSHHSDHNSDEDFPLNHMENIEMDSRKETP